MQGKHQNQSDNRVSFKDKARQMSQKAASLFSKASKQGDHSSRDDRGSRRPRKQNAIKRIINRWCDRLLGVVTERSFDQEEEFESHRTSRDYICNTLGTGAWGMVFPILTIVVTQLSGVEQAGMFSMAFIIGTLLMIVGNYGVRTYQVSDIGETHSFFDYQVNRWITCAIMMLVAYVYCSIRGYYAEMFSICMAVCAYKMIDGLADVYEGRLQQMDKLYLAGISQAFRSVVVFVAFSIALLFTRNLVVASIVMAVVAALTFVVLTFPLAQLETPRSRGRSFASILSLFKQCFPVFIALFMYALIDNMPKFVMEGVLSYDNQLYFNALYFPAQAILLTVGSIYKPLLVRMAEMWADAEKRSRFDLVILAIVGVVIVITLVVIVIMGWIGIPIMSFMYGVDFEQFRGLSYIMIAAGGVTAIIDFLYQVITVLRRQKSVMKLYLITFGFSLFVPILLIDFTGLPGAVIGYLIVMTILLVLLVWEYISIRVDLHRHPERVEETLAGEEAAARAYEESVVGAREREEHASQRMAQVGRGRSGNRSGAAGFRRSGIDGSDLNSSAVGTGRRGGYSRSGGNRTGNQSQQPGERVRYGITSVNTDRNQQRSGHGTSGFGQMSRPERGAQALSDERFSASENRNAAHGYSNEQHADPSIRSEAGRSQNDRAHLSNLPTLDDVTEIVASIDEDDRDSNDGHRGGDGRSGDSRRSHRY